MIGLRRLRVLCDSRWQHHGNPGADADVAQVLDGAERLQVLPDAAVLVDQGVAAGEQHVVDLRMGADVGRHLAQVACDFIGVAAHHALAEAVAAVHRALVGGQHQRGLPVLVLHARDHGVPGLPAGVLQAAGEGLHGVRYAEPADGIVHPVGADQAQIVGRDADRILFRNGIEPVDLPVGQVKRLPQGLGAAYARAEQLL